MRGENGLDSAAAERTDADAASVLPAFQVIVLVSLLPCPSLPA
jgi:hypothetical protein